MKNVCNPDYRALSSTSSEDMHIRITAQMYFWLHMCLYTGCDLRYQGAPEIIFNTFIIVHFKSAVEKQMFY